MALSLKRELAAGVAIPIVLAVLFLLPPIAFDVLAGAVTLAALYEFCRLAEKAGHPVSKTVALGGGAAVLALWAPLWGYAGTPDRRGLTVAVVLCLGVAALASVAPLFSGVDPAAALGSSGATLYGVFALALPATAMSALREFSPKAVLLLFLIVWGCDSFAYYAGRAFGRRLLAPRVSPKKTWEGTIGGLLGATAVGAASGVWILPEIGPVRGAVAGALASTAGQIGDLVESLWKRGAGVKDSGVFLPGHGGFYDRIDSLIWAAPVLALIVATL
ncbi:MAG TPA: phosphatidate cytidylyltransferase [Thermoanaerobaculia bacterium]